MFPCLLVSSSFSSSSSSYFELSQQTVEKKLVVICVELEIDSYSGPVDALTIAIIKWKIYIRYDEFVIHISHTPFSIAVSYLILRIYCMNAYSRVVPFSFSLLVRSLLLTTNLLTFFLLSVVVAGIREQEQ